MRNFTARALSILGLFLLLSSSIFAQIVNADDDAFTLNVRDGEATFDVSLNDTLTKFDLAYYTVIQEPKHHNATFYLDEYVGVFTYVAQSGFIGRDTFIYLLCDDEMCDTATVVINVVMPNNHFAVNDTFSIDFKEDIYLGYLDENDKNLDDNQNYTYSLISTPKYGIASIDAFSEIKYKSIQDFSGNDTFRYRSCNGDGICSEATIYVSLDARPPVAIDDNIEVAYNRNGVFEVHKNDKDPNGFQDLYPEKYSILKKSVGTRALFDTATGEFLYTPANNFTGKDTVWYVATDGQYFDTARIFINVLPPALVWADNVEMDFDLAHNSNEEHYLDDYVTYDEDFDNVTFKMFAPAKYGKIIFDGIEEIRYSTTNMTFIGRDTASYIVCTQNGVCDTALIIVNVRNSNTAPFADDDYFYTKGEQINHDITFNDFDDENNIVASTLLTIPKFGIATLLVDGSFNYTPNRGGLGTDTLIYSICDKFGLCDTAMIFVEVDTKNMLPIKFEIQTNMSQVCLGRKVDMFISSNQYNIIQGFWEESLDGTKFVRINTVETPTYSPNTVKAGMRYVRCVTSTNDTSNIQSLLINPDPVVISNPQDANLTFWVGTSDADSSAVFKVVTSVDPSLLTYQWQSSDDGINWLDMVVNSVNSGVTTDVLTLNNPRINADKFYRVLMSLNQQGCNIITSASATLTIKSKPVPVGSRPNTATITDKVFPNPTTGQVEVYLRTSAGAEITIANLVGQVLKSERINSQYVRLDLSGYINGTYLLTIKTAIGFETMKIVKY